MKKWAELEAQQYQLSILGLSASHPPNTNTHTQRHKLTGKIDTDTEWACVCPFICLPIFGVVCCGGGDSVPALQIIVYLSAYLLVCLLVYINAFRFRIECHTFCVSYLWISKQANKCMHRTHKFLFTMPKILSWPDPARTGQSYISAACHHVGVKVVCIDNLNHCIFPVSLSLSTWNGMNKWANERWSERLRGNIALHYLSTAKKNK